MAREVKPTDGFIFHGWMATELHLRGGELLSFAIVHQFTQSGVGKYLGGPSYIATWLGCSENTARKYLHALVEKGLVIVEEEYVRGLLFKNYKAKIDPLKNCSTPSKNLGDGCKNRRDPSKNLRQDNNIESNIDNNTSVEVYNNPQPLKKFDFRSALRDLGVSVEVVDAWMQVRKAKKAVNTEIAFNAIEREIARSGHTAEECIRLSVEKSWSGFRAEWMENANTAPIKRKDNVSRMLEVGREMGFIGGKYDDQ